MAVNTTQQQPIWFFRKGYLQGVFWAIMVCFISSLNDVFTRLAGTRLLSPEVAFFRAFFSMLTLLPILLLFDRNSFKTERLGLHIIRSCFLLGALTCWSAGVNNVPLSVVSTLAQTTPLFVLPMARLFLKEHVGWQRTIATLAGFLGIIVTIQSPSDGSLFSSINLSSLWLIGAAIFFASSDILNKAMISQESTLTMMFYLALGTTILGIAPALYVWQPPQLIELFWLLCLGTGANLILYCLLKAFAATDISALMPYRYAELIIAGAFGYAIFGEVPTIATIIGAMIIIPSTLLIAIYETHKRYRKKSRNNDNGHADFMKEPKHSVSPSY